MKEVLAYTDGSCLGNPGPGGWAAILRYGGAERELSGGFSLTTNNRMELLALIKTLDSLTEPCQVVLYTDSRYVRDAVEKGWLAGWQKKGWKTAGKTDVKNRDLWEQVVPQLAYHKVTLSWIRGHTGHPENERCDVLAKAEASKKGQPTDRGFSNT